jgi:hypothetical protein
VPCSFMFLCCFLIKFLERILVATEHQFTCYCCKFFRSCQVGRFFVETGKLETPFIECLEVGMTSYDWLTTQNGNLGK